MKKLIFLPLLLLVLATSLSCESKDPALLKVFVRSSSNQLVSGAKVIVIGDQQSNPATLEFVDTSYTNSSGFTVIDMNEYFDVSGKDNTTGYFDIIVKYNNKIATGYSRCRIHTTSVETIYLPN
ncbi:MAG: hypothetical protein EBQ94_09345 [Flavobacteriales bacterium]|jgi:hypothetical protein|nr:hypothetical protein [Crocinitomicaceae bacterium]NBX80564.1 hypothetical protein [Flavobacteriales bacterium]NCA19838.1 hypothetical protein [Crocinitomicaceae bacterium]